MRDIGGMLSNDTNFGDWLQELNRCYRDGDDINEKIIKPVKEVIQYAISNAKIGEEQKLILEVPSDDGKSMVPINIKDKMQQIYDLIDGKKDIKNDELDNFFTKFFRQEEVVKQIMERGKKGQDTEKIKEYLKAENQKLEEKREAKSKVNKSTKEDYEKIKQIKKLIEEIVNYDKIDDDHDNVIEGLEKLGINVGKESIKISDTITKSTKAGYVTKNKEDLKTRLKAMLSEAEKSIIKKCKEEDKEFDEAQGYERYLNNLEIDIYNLDAQISANQKIIDNIKNFINPELPMDISIYKKMIDSGINVTNIGKKTVNGNEYIGHVNNNGEFIYTDKNGKTHTTDISDVERYNPTEIDIDGKKAELESKWNNRTGSVMTEEQINARVSSYGLSEDDIKKNVIIDKLNNAGKDINQAKAESWLRKNTSDPSLAKAYAKEYMENEILEIAGINIDEKLKEAAEEAGYDETDYDYLEDDAKKELLNLYAMQKILGDSVIKADDYKEFVGITDFDDAFEEGYLENAIKEQTDEMIKTDGKIDESKLKAVLGDKYKKPLLGKRRKLRGNISKLVKEKAKEKLKNKFDNYKTDVKILKMDSAKNRMKEDLVDESISGDLKIYKAKLVEETEKKRFLRDGLNDYAKTELDKVMADHKENGGIMNEVLSDTSIRSLYNNNYSLNRDPSIPILTELIKKFAGKKENVFSPLEHQVLKKNNKKPTDPSHVMPEIEEGR